MADMEVLEAKEKVVKEKLDPEKKKVIESANEERTIKPNSETADKIGKIKRRGKKKAKELIGLNLIKKLKTLNIAKMMFILNGSMMVL